MIATLAVIAFMLISSVYVYKRPTNDTIIPYDYAKEEIPGNFNEENPSEEVIMGFMGNKTEK